ncbi:hypothetical protein EOA24_29430 [Mesorhizobium sp. M2A.F.Ca.ET.039.01.1.1]|nr:hypothetical protein EOA24_29430 [Mesorhizobium sp. M2A.F.Ca.ET.039.01.1.1]
MLPFGASSSRGGVGGRPGGGSSRGGGSGRRGGFGGRGGSGGTGGSEMVTPGSQSPGRGVTGGQKALPHTFWPSTSIRTWRSTGILSLTSGPTASVVDPAARLTTSACTVAGGACHPAAPRCGVSADLRVTASRRSPDPPRSFGNTIRACPNRDSSSVTFSCTCVIEPLPRRTRRPEPRRGPRGSLSAARSP